MIRRTESHSTREMRSGIFQPAVLNRSFVSALMLSLPLRTYEHHQDFKRFMPMGMDKNIFLHRRTPENPQRITDVVDMKLFMDRFLHEYPRMRIFDK